MTLSPSLSTAPTVETDKVLGGMSELSLILMLQGLVDHRNEREIIEYLTTIKSSIANTAILNLYNSYQFSL